MGHSTGRSKAKMKAFLDNIEKEIDGQRKMEESGTDARKMKKCEKEVL